MNPEEQDERAMPSDTRSNQGAAGPSEAAASETAASEAGEPRGDAPPRAGATDVQAYIGRQLRAVYDDVVKQPIPDRFLALMKQLEEGTGKP